MQPLPGMGNWPVQAGWPGKLTKCCRESAQENSAGEAGVSRLKAGQTGPVKILRKFPQGQAVDTSQLPKAIAASAKLVDATLDAVLPQPAGRQARVQEAMRYAIMAGGKRLRPFLVLHSARLFGVDDSRSLAGGRGDRGAAHLQPGA